MRQTIRLNESQLTKIIKESVKRVLREDLAYSTNPIKNRQIMNPAKAFKIAIEEGWREYDDVLQELEDGREASIDVMDDYSGGNYRSEYSNGYAAGRESDNRNARDHAFSAAIKKYEDLTIDKIDKRTYNNLADEFNPTTR